MHNIERPAVETAFFVRVMEARSCAHHHLHNMLGWNPRALFCAPLHDSPHVAAVQKFHRHVVGAEIAVDVEDIDDVGMAKVCRRPRLV